MWEIYSGMSIIYGVILVVVAIPSSSSTTEGSNHRDLKPSTYYRWSDVHQSVRESVDFPTPREELPMYSNGHYVSTDTYIAWRRCWLAETREKLVRCSTLFCGKVAALFIIKVDRGSVF